MSTPSQLGFENIEMFQTGQSQKNQIVVGVLGLFVCSIFKTYKKTPSGDEGRRFFRWSEVSATLWNSYLSFKEKKKKKKSCGNVRNP